MRIAVAVAVLMGLVGCRHEMRVDSARPVVPYVSGTTAELKGDVVLTNRQQVADYTRRMMGTLAPSITFRLEMSGAYDVAYAVADELLRDGVAVAFSVRGKGSQITLVPTYADNEVMLVAISNPSIRSGLSADRKRALALAEKIVKDVCSGASSDYERALALHDYLVLNCTYTPSLHGVDTANATARLLLTNRGVCDAYTRTYRLLLSIAGIENKFVAGIAQGDNHCWNLVRLDGHWVHVDCTYSDPTPDAPGRVCRSHFALTDSLIARDHSWNRDGYPVANSAQLYYPFRYAAFDSVYDLTLWCSRQADKPGYVTAYVDEIYRCGADMKTVQLLFGQAHAELGLHVVRSFTLEDAVPGVIVCKCE
ncbi:MAG: transglutaminase domain-containing protein [Akkermansia sp.]|nr:transglutaminase domain-containing protein [Akkermansia sp.]